MALAELFIFHLFMHHTCCSSTSHQGWVEVWLFWLIIFIIWYKSILGWLVSLRMRVTSLLEITERCQNKKGCESYAGPSQWQSSRTPVGHLLLWWYIVAQTLCHFCLFQFITQDVHSLLDLNKMFAIYSTKDSCLTITHHAGIPC